MIHVFRTTVESEDHVAQITPALNQLLGHPAVWNFDLEDSDRILRIFGATPEAAHHCTRVLRENGFTCEELPD